MTKQDINDFKSVVTNAISDIKRLNSDLTEQVNVKLQKLERQTLETPVNLEGDILKATQEAIGNSIKSVLTGYNSPLVKLISSVIDGRDNKLREIISSAFDSVIRTEDFKKSIVDGFSHKIARSIISNNDGLFDKVSNELKQSSEFKAKMTLAVANVVNECLKK